MKFPFFYKHCVKEKGKRREIKKGRDTHSVIERKSKKKRREKDVRLIKFSFYTQTFCRWCFAVDGVGCGGVSCGGCGGGVGGCGGGCGDCCDACNGGCADDCSGESKVDSFAFSAVAGTFSNDCCGAMLSFSRRQVGGFATVNVWSEIANVSIFGFIAELSSTVVGADNVASNLSVISF
uniref:Uncharacterized protein n=1 Tax=Glossina palpalis gambiensis TaxID=67801 RepID=A0A1B0BBV8_9MUSC